MFPDGQISLLRGASRSPSIPTGALYVTLVLILLSSSSIESSQRSEFRCTSVMSTPVESLKTMDASFVNVTFQQAVNNRLILFDDSSSSNLTVIVRRRSDVIGPLCIYVNLTSVDVRGDPSNPPSSISVDGLPYLASEDNADASVTDGDIVEFQFTVELLGKRLGRALLMVSAKEQSTSDDVTQTMVTSSQSTAFQVSGSGRYMIQVNRPKLGKLAIASVLLLAIAMSLNMFSYACRLHADIVIYHIKHPFGVLTGLGCQFIIMPTIAFLFGLAFNLDTHMRYALLVLGCCPGGGPSNLVTLLLRGDIHMSVIMTCASNFLSIGMMPLWLSTLGTELMRKTFPTYSFPVPWIALVVFGLLFSVPAVVGHLFSRCVKDRTAAIVGISIRIGCLVAVLVGFVGTIYSNTWVFEYLNNDWKMIVAVSLFSHIGYIVSLVISVIGRRSVQTSLTITIEAGFQSMPSMIFVLQLTCPQPESMLGFSVAAIYFFNMVAATVVACVVLPLLSRIRWRHEKPFAMKTGHDSSPNFKDSYSMELNGQQPGLKSIFSKDKGKFGNLGERNGSFSSLPEKY